MASPQITSTQPLRFLELPSPIRLLALECWQMAFWGRGNEESQAWLVAQVDKANSGAAAGDGAFFADKHGSGIGATGFAIVNEYRPLTENADASAQA